MTDNSSFQALDGHLSIESNAVHQALKEMVADYIRDRAALLKVHADLLSSGAVSAEAAWQQVLHRKQVFFNDFTHMVNNFEYQIDMICACHFHYTMNQGNHSQM